MPPDRSTDPLLDAEHARFIRGPVSIVVGSRDAANVPTLVHASGCRVSPDRRRVTVFVQVSAAVTLLSDVLQTRAVAVVFTEPHSHRTIQLKGSDATLEPLACGDLETIEGHVGDLVGELASIGHPEAFTRAMFHCDPEDTGAIAFTVEAAFAQTPGPGAGGPLGAAR